MSDAAPASAQPSTPAAPKKGKATAKKAKVSPGKTKGPKPKAPSNHPPFLEMAVAAVQSLKEHKGSSRQAILKYIMANFNVGNDAKLVNSRLKTALKKGVTTGSLKQSKGTGAAGSFRLGEKKPSEVKSLKKPRKPVAAPGSPKPKATKKAKPAAATAEKKKPGRKPGSPKKASAPAPSSVPVASPSAAAPAAAKKLKAAKKVAPAPKKPASPKKTKAAAKPKPAPAAKKPKSPKKAKAAGKAKAPKKSAAKGKKVGGSPGASAPATASAS